MVVVATRPVLCGGRRRNEVDRAGVLLSDGCAPSLVARTAAHPVAALSLAQCDAGGRALCRLGSSGREHDRLGDPPRRRAARGTAAPVARASWTPLSLARMAHFPGRVPGGESTVVGPRAGDAVAGIFPTVGRAGTPATSMAALLDVAESLVLDDSARSSSPARAAVAAGPRRAGGAGMDRLAG